MNMTLDEKPFVLKKEKIARKRKSYIHITLEIISLMEMITVSNDGRIVVTLKGGFREEEII